MPFGWGIVSTGKHPDIKIAPAMAVAGGGEPSRPRTPNAHCAWASTMRPSVPAATSSRARR